jgi:hypothetical protein
MPNLPIDSFFTTKLKNSDMDQSERYVDKKYGYSFEYPIGWKKQVLPNSVQITLKEKTGLFSSKTVAGVGAIVQQHSDKFPTAESAFQQMFMAARKGPKRLDATSITDTQLAGMPAKRMEMQLHHPGKGPKSYICVINEQPHNGYFYAVMMFMFRDKNADLYKQIFEKAVSSFRFE